MNWARGKVKRYEELSLKTDYTEGEVAFITWYTENDIGGLFERSKAKNDKAFDILQSIRVHMGREWVDSRVDSQERRENAMFSAGKQIRVKKTYFKKLARLGMMKGSIRIVGSNLLCTVRGQKEELNLNEEFGMDSDQILAPADLHLLVPNGVEVSETQKEEIKENESAPAELATA